jgi:uncharacterized protein (DUF2141 family)
MKKAIVLLTLIVISSSFTTIASNDKLTIKVTINNPEASGTIYMSLYNKETDFNEKKSLQHKLITITSNSPVTVSFDDLPKGDYAIVCFQDTNANQKLDFTSFIPDEPWGLSNNVMLMGPPTWKDAQFRLDKDTHIEIQLF